MMKCRNTVHRSLLSVFALMLVVSTGGCISSKTFVDPTFGKTKYEQLPRKAEPLKWRVVAEFQRNGEHLQAVDGELLGHVERVIRATGIAVPTTDAGEPEIKVIVNNVADLGSAAGKGVLTGLTFGAAGTMVTDYYEMQVVFTGNGGKSLRRDGYKHALHTTVGNASGPPGLEPTTPAAGFGKVVEEMLLNAINDLMKEVEACIRPSWWARVFASLRLSHSADVPKSTS